jgi:hypothetical protein
LLGLGTIGTIRSTEDEITAETITTTMLLEKKAKKKQQE